MAVIVFNRPMPLAVGGGHTLTSAYPSHSFPSGVHFSPKGREKLLNLLRAFTLIRLQIARRPTGTPGLAHN